MRHLAPAHQAAVSTPVRLERHPFLAWKQEPVAVAALAGIRVDIADAVSFSSLQEQWSDLVLRAAEPNPFLDPIILAGVLGRKSASEAPVLLAWHGQRLVGVWAFIRGRLRSGTPLPVLKAPIDPLLPNATPVVDADFAERALSAMLDAIKSSPDLPRILSVAAFDSGGPVMTALQRVCSARGHEPAILRAAQRPQLIGRQEPAAYFAQVMSSSRRKKIGQLRRRLATRGRVELKVHRGEAAVGESLERFMRLEAEGWKGISGNPFLGTPGALFARETVPCLAAQGAAEIWELALNDQAVSMAIILRQGGTAFDWKIAYDEQHGDCSPGVLLAQDYTTSFLSDGATRFADSCAADDTGLLGPLWTGRQSMADVLLDCRGRTATFVAAAMIETGYAKARRLTKKAISLTRLKPRGRR